jgi:hypothetical protein
MSGLVIPVFAAAASAVALVGTAFFLSWFSLRVSTSQAEDAHSVFWFQLRFVPAFAAVWFIVAVVVGETLVTLRLGSGLVPVLIAIVLTLALAIWIARGAARISAEEFAFGALIAALLTWLPLVVWWLVVSRALKPLVNLPPCSSC